MLQLYRTTAVLALRRAAKGWPVAFSLVLYAALLVAAGVLVAPLGIAGGILLSLAGAACFSSYLHLLAIVVSGGRPRLADLKQGFGSRFWDVVSVLFALWVISLAAGILVRGAGPNGPAIAAMAAIATAFFFNAVPELLYQGRSRSFSLLMESGRFVIENPVAWLLPNLLFAVALLAPTGVLRVERPAELLLVFGAVFSPQGLGAAMSQVPLWALPPLLLLLHYAMVFRGLLFAELASGNPRLRAFRARFG